MSPFRASDMATFQSRIPLSQILLSKMSPSVQDDPNVVVAGCCFLLPVVAAAAAFCCCVVAAVKSKPVLKTRRDANLNFVTYTFQIEIQMCLKIHNLPVE